MKKKRISKEVASEKYGIITTGVNSLYNYYLLPNGDVIDSDGDVRYTPKWNTDFPKWQQDLYDALNRMDALACEATEDRKTQKQLSEDYNLIFTFISENIRD